MKGKILIPAIFVAIFMVSRIPGLLPSNFSAAYALMFCAGAYFSGAMAWWLPMLAMLVTDVVLTTVCYPGSPVISWLMLANYGCYALLIGLGRIFGKGATIPRMIGGGLIGALIFYLATNTLSWFQDPAYAKTIAGWIQALTTGDPNWHPTTWEMFRNTMIATGLFTALFASTQKIAEESPADKTAGAREPEAESESKCDAEEAKA